MTVWWLIPRDSEAQRATSYLEQHLDRVDSDKWKWVTTARSLARQINVSSVQSIYPTVAYFNS